jgi:hypothetical protein
MRAGQPVGGHAERDVVLIEKSNCLIYPNDGRGSVGCHVISPEM